MICQCIYQIGSVNHVVRVNPGMTVITGPENTQMIRSCIDIWAACRKVSYGGVCETVVGRSPVCPIVLRSEYTVERAGDNGCFAGCKRVNKVVGQAIVDLGPVRSIVC